jgi:hypothetical protein
LNCIVLRNSISETLSLTGGELMAGVLEMGPEELSARLLAFDAAVALTYPGRRFRLVLVGGGAMVLLGYLQRATLDLDALTPPAELVSLMEAFDLNGRVAAYADHFAYNYEDRLVRLELATTAVECWGASLEDLVASKLHSDRESDAADVRRPEVLAGLDWDLLARAVVEMRDSSLNPRRYRAFLDNYEAYRRECGPCDD